MSVLEATAGLAIKSPIVANADLMDGKPSLIGITREEMADALMEIGVPQKQTKMRVSQLWNWLYVRGVSDFDHMTNVSKDLREKLKAHFTIARPEIVEEHRRRFEREPDRQPLLLELQRDGGGHEAQGNRREQGEVVEAAGRGFGLKPSSPLSSTARLVKAGSSASIASSSRRA